MARGGKRPGAGRKPGSGNKRTKVTAAKVIADGMTPLDVMLKGMRALAEEKKWEAAAAIAQRAAPYVHQKFSATTEPAVRHTEQKVQGDLFEPRPPAGSEPAADSSDDWDRVLN